MNEILVALEAMIRRIVQEELRPNDSVDILTAIKAADSANPSVMSDIICKHCVDQRWFDNAIAAEVDNKFDSNFRGTVREVVMNMEFTIDAR